MSSVCPSVTLMDQDHISWKSWKLITRTIRSTSSLFVAQRPSTYSHGNMGKFWGREKWRTEAQKLQYLWKRLKIDEKLLWRAYSNAPTLFQTVPCSTPTASPSPRLGVRNPNPKLQSLLCQEWVKLRTSNFWQVHSQGPFEQKPIKNFGEKGA